MFEFFVEQFLRFKEAFITTRAASEGSSFSDFEARKLRYGMNFSMVEGNIYRSIHSWSSGLKRDFGLYASIREIYNPTARIAAFYRDNIWRGALDPRAGENGAMPILIENGSEALRPAIARLFRDSNMKQLKSVLTFLGAIYGDVFIKIVDDVERQRVYLTKISPSIVKDIEKDSRGNIEAYTLEYKIKGKNGKHQKFIETCRKISPTEVEFSIEVKDESEQTVRFPRKWVEPYRFVPLVHIVHVSIGEKFGWSEFHDALPKLIELDDNASKVYDQIRKAVDPIWLFNFKRPTASGSVLKDKAKNTSLTQSTEPERPLSREESNAIYVGDPSARAQPLVSELDIMAALDSTQRLIKELEAQFPELQMDLWQSNDAVSGKAISIARERLTSKLADRRSVYDHAIVSAIQMALAIAGLRKYDGYEQFSMDSFSSGNLDFQIAWRPVFEENRNDVVTNKSKVWASVITAMREGVNPLFVLHDFGYSDEMIAKLGNIGPLVTPGASEESPSE